jgi:hypothetical protein
MMKPVIDRKKFSNEIRKFSGHHIHYMLLDAIDILPQSKLKVLDFPELGIKHSGGGIVGIS